MLEHGGNEDEAIAALLHDVVEDCGVSLAEIREGFGSQVASIGDGCTDTCETPKPPWKARKEAYIARVRATIGAPRVGVRQAAQRARDTYRSAAQTAQTSSIGSRRDGRVLSTCSCGELYEVGAAALECAPPRRRVDHAACRLCSSPCEARPAWRRSVRAGRMFREHFECVARPGGRSTDRRTEERELRRARRWQGQTSPSQALPPFDATGLAPHVDFFAD